MWVSSREGAIPRSAVTGGNLDGIEVGFSVLGTAPASSVHIHTVNHTQIITSELKQTKNHW